MGQQEENIIVKMMVAQNERLEKMSAALIKHIETEESAINKFITAFPEGDLEGHRRYHQLLIEEAEDRKKMRQAIITKSTVSLIWVLLCALASAVWAYFIAAVKTGKAGG